MTVPPWLKKALFLRTTFLLFGPTDGFDCFSRIAEQFERLVPAVRQVHYSGALPFLNSATSFSFSVCVGSPLTFLVLSDQLQCMAGTWRASASQLPGFVPDVASGEAMQGAVVLVRGTGSISRYMKCAGLDWDSSSGNEILITGACLAPLVSSSSPRRHRL